MRLLVFTSRATPTTSSVRIPFGRPSGPKTCFGKYLPTALLTGPEPPRHAFADDGDGLRAVRSVAPKSRPAINGMRSVAK